MITQTPKFSGFLSQKKIINVKLSGKVNACKFLLRRKRQKEAPRAVSTTA